jgi:GT2 family glycosyltransferase
MATGSAVLPLATRPSRVAVILVSWNGWRECIECLDTLLAQGHDDFHIFIVDNDSDDGSAERIASWCGSPHAEPFWRSHAGVRRYTDGAALVRLPCRVTERPSEALAPAPDGCRVTIVRAGANRGFASGCNVGVLAAGLENFEFFWFLNPDTVVHADALVGLLERAAEAPAIGMVGSMIRYYDRPDVIQAMGGARLDRSNCASFLIGVGTNIHDTQPDARAVEAEMAYVTGASLLATRRFIAEIGPMQEDYFLYFEEIDWAFRGAGRFRLGYAPASQVFHKSGANSSRVRSLFCTRFYYRNRLRFAARYLPGSLRAARWLLFTEMLRHLARGRAVQVRALIPVLLHAKRIVAEASRSVTRIGQTG